MSSNPVVPPYYDFPSYGPAEDSKLLRPDPRVKRGASAGELTAALSVHDCTNVSISVSICRG